MSGRSLQFNRIDRAVLDLHLAGVKRMNAWVAVSNATAQDAVERLRISKERVYTVHHCIDGALYRPIEDAYDLLPPMARFKTDHHQFYLLYVGNELPRKNLGCLLKALKRLKDQGYAPRLIKVGPSGGDRWREMFLRQIHNDRLTDDVLLLGQVDESVIPLLYNAADVFVTTSVMEGFGYPLLEAMSCGTPAIASRIASLPEIGGDAPAWIDAPRDPESVAASISSVLDTRDSWDAMRKRGLRQASVFTFEQYINRTLEVYRSFD